jgi:hypothetical protein
MSKESDKRKILRKTYVFGGSDAARTVESMFKSEGSTPLKGTINNNGTIFNKPNKGIV